MPNVSARFFQGVQLTNVRLRVRDLAALRRFYADVLGLTVLSADAAVCRLGVSAGGAVLLELEAAPAAPARPSGTAGLFHIAWLFPDRASLGRMVRRLAEQRVAFGSGDHGVSEAIYLDDPEGNGLELYVDRPVEAWPPAGPDGQVTMYTQAVDLASLIADGDRTAGPFLPAETRIGHLHLGVSDLARAEEFYGRTLGFAVRQRDFPGALFLGRDGYHHHFGANTWQTRRAAVPGARGLANFTIRFAAPAELARVVAAVRAAGRPVEDTAGGCATSDLDGLTLTLAGG